MTNETEMEEKVKLARELFLAVLLNKEIECTEAMFSDAATSTDGESFCSRVWDGIMCWPPTPAGTLQQLSCPDYVDGFKTHELATRYCTLNATWYVNPTENRTWTNYSSCGYSTADVVVGNSTLIADWLPVIKRISQVGYGVSLGTLLIALFILASFKKLSCPRNTLHMHLFISFIMRALMALLKDNFFLNGMDLTQVGDGPVDPIILLQHHGSWHCKLVTSLWQYFIMANYSWIFMEGLYLHNLIFLALFTDSSAITVYIVLGWGLPVLFVVPWIVLKALLDDVLCWTTNINGNIFWLIRGPIIISIVINFILFVHITWVLLSKLRSSVSAETRKYRYRKWAKSTLVLVPLFGVHYFAFVGMSGAIDRHEIVEVIWLFCDQSFASFQGFLVAVLYCLMNGEVRGELSRRWKRWRQNHHMESPWSQYSITNNSRSNTTRWRTSFHSLPLTSIGERRDNSRMGSLTPSGTSCAGNNGNSVVLVDGSTPRPSYGSSSRNIRSSNPGLNQKLDMIVSESDGDNQHLDHTETADIRIRSTNF